MSYRKVSEMLDAWQLGPFGKHPDNPILGPGRNPELGAENLYNPTAYTDGEAVTLLLRAQAEDGTSAICRATSDDGVNFRVDADAVLLPTEDYETPGGCEDPRVAVLDGTAYLTYTGYGMMDGERAPRLCLATTRDLEGWRGWEKHGPMFSDEESSRDGRAWSKAGQILPVRAAGRMWMHWGEKGIRTASSEDGLSWEAVSDGPDAARERPFESEIMEVGATVPTEAGLLMVYAAAAEDKVYRAVQMLWDAERPWEVLARAERPFLEPETPRETDGEVDDVVFAQGLVRFRGQWLLYYGMADRRIGVASTGDLPPLVS